jgi:beta-lactamase class A
MRALMARDLAAPVTDPDGEGRFLGPGLPPGCRLWSKAGWTSETRHDAAYVERPDGRRSVVVAFTTGHAQDREILPALARALFARLP